MTESMVINRVSYVRTYVGSYAKQKHLAIGCKKGEANQKQELPDYG